MIAAMAHNRVIGRDGQMPWHIPSDLQRFRQLTMGHVMLMGRTTCDAIGRALDGRRTLVLSRNSDFTMPGCEVVSSLAAALVAAEGAEHLFVCGGEEIYRQCLPLAQRLYLTVLLEDVSGDRFFPCFNRGAFELTHHERVQDSIDYDFNVYERR